MQYDMIDKLSNNLTTICQIRTFSFTLSNSPGRDHWLHNTATATLKSIAEKRDTSLQGGSKLL